VWKPNGNEKLGRPGLRWKDNIKMDLQEIMTTQWVFCGVKKYTPAVGGPFSFVFKRF
jgi:hypothetical protein